MKYASLFRGRENGKGRRHVGAITDNWRSTGCEDWKGGILPAALRKLQKLITMIHSPCLKCFHWLSEVFRQRWNSSTHLCISSTECLVPNVLNKDNYSSSHLLLPGLWTCMCAKSLQLCQTLSDPMDCSPPGSSVHGILQARILERVAMPSSWGSSQPRDRTCVSHVSGIGRWVLYH